MSPLTGLVILYVAVFAISLVYDWLFIAWHDAFELGEMRAVWLSGALTLLSIGLFLICVNEWLCVVPTVVGHMLGTAVAIRRRRDR